MRREGWRCSCSDAGTSLDGAVQYMAAIKRPVTVIGDQPRHATRRRRDFTSAARPDALVLTSRISQPPSRAVVQTSCRSWDRRPRCRARSSSITARIGCKHTLPAGVTPSSSGRRADVIRAAWLSGGTVPGRPHVRRAPITGSTALMVRLSDLRRGFTDIGAAPRQRGRFCVRSDEAEGLKFHADKAIYGIAGVVPRRVIPVMTAPQQAAESAPPWPRRMTRS